MLKYALIFSLFVFPVLAGVAWTLPTFGPIEAKPVFFGDKMVVASYDGTIYYVYLQSGAIAQKTTIGEAVDTLRIGNGRIIAASGSKIIILDKSGNIVRTLNESVIYGIETGEDIYVTGARGLEALDYEGKIIWLMLQQGKTLTEPLLLQDRVIFGAGDEIVVAGLNGNEISRVRVAQFWKSKPEFHDGVVYIGSTDGNMYAVELSIGKILWAFSTGGWIMSDPIYNRGTVYFGSNDGYVYALNANTGALVWKKKTGEAVQGEMEIAQLGGTEVLIVGSNDNRVYALDVRTGNVTLAFSAGGWVRNPTLYLDKLYFGSYDGSYYAYTLNRACSIDSPLSGESVGYLPFDVSGRVFSRYPGARVFVRIDDSMRNGSWAKAIVSGNDWTHTVEPTAYEPGRLLVECRVGDSAGEESAASTYVVLYRDINLEKGKMKIEAPASVNAGKAFEVKATDANRKPLDEFRIIVGGKTFSEKNGTALVNITEPGRHSMLVRKTGYEDEKIEIDVNYDLSVILSAVIAAVAVIGVAFYLFVYKKK